jgi:GNAT superfamily N-acetyltransferase
VIRGFEPADAHAVSAIFHEEEPPQLVTPAGVLHWLRAQPERSRGSMWIAEDAGRVVGWAEATLRWTTQVEGVVDVWAYVAPRARGRGLGAALYAEAERHAREIGARTLDSWTYLPAGCSFLEARGFRAEGGERLSRLELDTADTSRLASLAKEKASEGFHLTSLAEVRDRVADLHRVYAAATADIPEAFPENDLRLEEWRQETLEHPQLSGEGSFVVLADGVPVALAFIELDEPAGLAASEMTGTVPEFRRRGLARLAKLATIRWATEQGLMAMVTSNAVTNLGMLHLNESLGYRPVLMQTHYVRDDLS